MVTLQYRKATLDDIEEICSLISHAIDEMIEHDILQWDELYPTREDFLHDINQNSLYAGLSDGLIVIVYALNQECDKEYQNGLWKYPNEPYYVVHRLCVHPDFQHKSIAKQTLLHIEAELSDNDIHAIRLDVFSNNPYALKLYDSLHYTAVGHADWRKGKFYLMEKYF